MREVCVCMRVCMHVYACVCMCVHVCMERERMLHWMKTKIDLTRPVLVTTRDTVAKSSVYTKKSWSALYATAQTVRGSGAIFLSAIILPIHRSGKEKVDGLFSCS